MQHNSTEMYNIIAEKYAAAFKEKKEEVSFIHAFLDLIPKGGSILDLGCGNCDYYYLFQKYPVLYRGIDISTGMIEVAKKQWPNGNFILGDILKIELEEAAYSGIFAFFSLIHFNDIEFNNIIAKIRNSLSNNGLLLLGVQEGDGELFKESPFLQGPKLYINLFRESELSSFLVKQGFEILQKEIKHSASPKELPFSKLLLLLKITK